MDKGKLYYYFRVSRKIYFTAAHGIEYKLFFYMHPTKKIQNIYAE